MNYIKQLQRENEEAKRRLQAIQDACQDYRAFLLSDKFQGFDSDGDRKDWISTSDVNAMLESLHSKALVG